MPVGKMAVAKYESLMQQEDWDLVAAEAELDRNTLRAIETNQDSFNEITKAINTFLLNHPHETKNLMTVKNKLSSIVNEKKRLYENQLELEMDLRTKIASVHTEVADLKEMITKLKIENEECQSKIKCDNSNI